MFSLYAPDILIHLILTKTMKVTIPSSQERKWRQKKKGNMLPKVIELVSG